MTATARKIVPDPHARLAALAAAVRADTLDAQARQQLADMLARAALGEDANAALGFRRGPGRRAWSTVTALAERDRLLRLAAQRLAPGAPKAEQARVLHAALVRYHSSSAWQRERTLDRCPDRHAGRVEGHLWGVLRARDYVPAARSIRLVLAMSS